MHHAGLSVSFEHLLQQADSSPVPADLCLYSDPLIGVHPAVLGVHLLKACSTGVNACTVTIMAVLLRVLTITAALQLVVKLPVDMKQCAGEKAQQATNLISGTNCTNSLHQGHLHSLWLLGLILHLKPQLQLSTTAGTAAKNLNMCCQRPGMKAMTPLLAEHSTVTAKSTRPTASC